MKFKMLVVGSVLFFSFASLAQVEKKHDTKKEWNPEEKVEGKVERFSQKAEITDQQAEALSNVLTDYYEEKKNMRAEHKDLSKEEHKVKMQEAKDKKEERIKQALNDEKLFVAWKNFEKEEKTDKKLYLKKKHDHDKSLGTKHQKERESKKAKEPKEVK